VDVRQPWHLQVLDKNTVKMVAAEFEVLVVDKAVEAPGDKVRSLWLPGVHFLRVVALSPRNPKVFGKK
jgi:hypothetical protein